MLEVGQVTEVVTVQGGPDQLQTANATLGNVVEQKAIETLPLNGRNPLTLLLLEPGVVQRLLAALAQAYTSIGSRSRLQRNDRRHRGQRIQRSQSGLESLSHQS